MKAHNYPLSPRTTTFNNFGLVIEPPAIVVPPKETNYSFGISAQVTTLPRCPSYSRFFTGYLCLCWLLRYYSVQYIHSFFFQTLWSTILTPSSCVTRWTFSFIQSKRVGHVVLYVMWSLHHRFFVHIFLTVVLLAKGHWLIALLNVPLIAYNVNRYRQKKHLLDNTRVFSIVGREQRFCEIKMGFFLLTFFVYLYW